MPTKLPLLPIVLSLSVACLAGCGAGERSAQGTASVSGPASSSASAPESAGSTQELTRHGVKVSIPAAWKPAPDREGRYQGTDGFAQIELSQRADSSAEAACRDQAGHKLQPYGSKPTIETLTVNGQPACLVLPSQDQREDMGNEAVVIVRLPRPQTLGGQTYGFAVLYADASSIRQIAETVRLPG